MTALFLSLARPLYRPLSLLFSPIKFFFLLNLALLRPQSVSEWVSEWVSFSIPLDDPFSFFFSVFVVKSINFLTLVPFCWIMIFISTTYALLFSFLSYIFSSFSSFSLPCKDHRNIQTRPPMTRGNICPSYFPYAFPPFLLFPLVKLRLSLSISTPPQVRSRLAMSRWPVPCWLRSWTTSWVETPSSTGMSRATSRRSSWTSSPEGSAIRWEDRGVHLTCLIKKIHCVCKSFC